jgi:hypothetical protein
LLREFAAWIGKDGYRFWRRIAQSIEQNYPGIFNPDWLFGGKKHGWGLRYKKGKSFCTLVPEKNRLLIQIVFGAEERAKVEMIRRELSLKTQEAYDSAATYHDGKWLLLPVDSESIATDVERLLEAKRKPKKNPKTNA